MRSKKIHLKKAGLKKILSKPKGNQTAYRDAQSGIGLNNPRIKKMRGYC